MSRYFCVSVYVNADEGGFIGILRLIRAGRLTD